MRNHPYFVAIFSICLIIGIIFAIINNDIIIEPTYHNPKLIENNINHNNNEEIRYININKDIKEEESQNKIKEEEEFWKLINEREKELRKKQEERKKKIEEVIKNQTKEEKSQEIKNDKENELKKIDENIINKVDYELEYIKKNKFKISCVYSIDNAHLYPSLVSITSLTVNAGEKTFYYIYIIINNEFTEKNKKILKSVEENYPNNCEIIFININDTFKDGEILIPEYYKLELPNLLSNVNKIIWMNGDTLIFEDLTELINLNMEGNYIMGFLDSLPDSLINFNISNATVIHSGVLLMDLDALRNNNITEKFTKFIIEEYQKIDQYDQTVINVVCQKNIALLPPKYGMWSFETESLALKHNEKQRPHLRYNKDEFIKAYHHPAILNFIWPKPYMKRASPFFYNDWWNYARKSGYYNEIYNKSPRFITRLLSYN